MNNTPTVTVVDRDDCMVVDYTESIDATLSELLEKSDIIDGDER